jgi:transposase
VSGYEDLVKAGVRLKNQRSSLFRAVGLDAKKKGVNLSQSTEQFVLSNLDEQIKAYEVAKKSYEKEIEQLGKKSKDISNQKSLAGIGWINAIKIVARVISPRRFKNKGDYLCYCGLVQLEKMSGGRSYGKKAARHSRAMKSVYKTAAIAAIGGENDFNGYYNYLIKEKRYPEYKARHAVARRIAIISLGIFKSGRPYKARTVN